MWGKKKKTIFLINFARGREAPKGLWPLNFNVLLHRKNIAVCTARLIPPFAPTKGGAQMGPSEKKFGNYKSS